MGIGVGRHKKCELKVSSKAFCKWKNYKFFQRIGPDFASIFDYLPRIILCKIKKISRDEKTIPIPKPIPKLNNSFVPTMKEKKGSKL